MKLKELFGDAPIKLSVKQSSTTQVSESIENELTDKVHDAIEQVIHSILNDASGIDGDFHFKSEHNSQSGNIIRLKGEGAYHLHDDQDAEEAMRTVESSEKEIADQVEDRFSHGDEYSHVTVKIHSTSERANTVLFKYEIQLVK
jgi:hypothetical protein